ncbi:MAG: hypothetical protein Q9159_001504 [Coniocarpon cinnabarinum]
MSEYWASTPRIWCKHCHAFYRDTPLDTRQHNNTGKHQSALQRSIRNLHKTTEREERDSARAKAEIERLNGVVSGAPVTKQNNIKNGGKTTDSGNAGSLSEGDRKRQIAQLAAMGVAVPEEYRREMAIASEWQTVSTRRLNEIGNGVKEEDGEDTKEGQEGWESSRGVRRRREEDDEDGEGDEGRRAGPKNGRERLGWGRRVKRYKEIEDEVDIEALMGKKEAEADKAKDEVAKGNPKHETGDEESHKDANEEAERAENVANAVDGEDVKGEDGAEAPLTEKAVVFKKRKKGTVGG